MSESMTRLETFVNMGYRKDPLKGVWFETGDLARMRRILTMAVESRAMVSIVGPRGVGKTDTVKATMETLGVKVVSVERAQKEKVTISDIQTALILDLSSESPKRGGETCSRQMRRIVGEASRAHKRGICLVIEEGQRMHSSTLKSLKTLREIEWMGEKELFTVVIVSQSDPLNRSGVSEVRLRTDTVRMQGPTPHEAAHYVRSTVGKHFEEEAIEALAELPEARNYLELQDLVITLLNIALADGSDQVTAKHVKEIAAPEAVAVPRATKAKQAAADVSPGAALKSVLGRHAGEPETDKRKVG